MRHDGECLCSGPSEDLYTKLIRMVERLVTEDRGDGMIPVHKREDVDM